MPVPMAGFPMCPKLAMSRITMPMAAPKAGNVNPAILSVPGCSMLAGRIQTAMASRVSEIGHAAPLAT